MRANRWSDSKLAKWLYGREVPAALPWGEWDKFWNEVKAERPIRYWIAHEGFNKLQDIVMWPIDKIYAIRYYLNNRFITKTHALTADPKNIKPGEWVDMDTRILYCMFDEFCRNFVESEAAWMNVIFDDEAKKAYNVPRWFWWKRNMWTSREAGLAWLKFQAENGHTLFATEAMDLYHWWRDVRPNRPDPHDASGWTAVCNAARDKDGDKFPLGEALDNVPNKDEALKKLREIEERYEQEDTDNLIRLIRIRSFLWT
jgi:hypothetical protein